MFHGPDWTPIPTFAADLRRAMQAPCWVVDGNYQSRVRELLWGEVEVVVWLDLPRRVVFPSLLARTLRRGIRRQRLWNGNRERLSSLLSTREEENLMLWTWNHYPRHRQNYLDAMTDPAFEHLRILRITRRSELPGLIRRIAPIGR